MVCLTICGCVVSFQNLRLYKGSPTNLVKEPWGQSTKARRRFLRKLRHWVVPLPPVFTFSISYLGDRMVGASRQESGSHLSTSNISAIKIQFQFSCETQWYIFFNSLIPQWCYKRFFSCKIHQNYLFSVINNICMCNIRKYV